MTLTSLEQRAIDLTAELANALGMIVSDGATRKDDLRELIHHVHVIQRYVMSQSAARTYPDQFRLLGEVGEWEGG